jgi:glycine/D-amino acid oxidase-like deaminating enzyme
VILPGVPLGAPHPKISHWFSELGGAPCARPALPGPREADVCVVGAGLTGLWTAYELRRADPSLDVVVLEREVAGFGASGRNGGWVSGELSGSRDGWAARGGRSGAIALERAIQATVDEVGRVVEAENIECDFVKGGSLHVAQTRPQLARLEAELAADRSWGFDERDSVLLDAGAAAGRVAVEGVLGARFTPHCARVQPAKLVRGLADAVERAGATLHEGTPVLAIEPHVARTPFGDVRARWVVRATEAYGAELPGLRRSVAPVNSSMIVTEPIGDATWEQLHWEGAETVLDGAHLYTYLQRTADGRIAIGGRGVPYRFGSRTGREGPVPGRTVAELHDRLIGLFGAAADVGVAAAWHGVLGVSRTWEPAVGADRATGLAWAGGYAGEGVAAANLAGRTLRDLLLGARTELTTLPWVGPPARVWEPEPLRFAGIHAVYRLLGAADRAERRRGRESRLAALADRLAGRSHG